MDNILVNQLHPEGAFISLIELRMQIPKITLRPARVKSASTVLIYRINYQKESLSRSTGINIHPKDWDFKRQRIKGEDKKSELINQEIISFRRKIEDLMIDLAANKCLSIRTLKDRINSNGQSTTKHNSENLIHLYKFEYLVNHSHLTPSSITTYSTTITRLLEFFNLTKDPEPFVSINEVNSMAFYNRFVTFLKENGNSNNTADKHIKHIIMLLNYAARKGYLKVFEFRDFKRFSEYAPKIYLTTDELLSISKTKLQDKQLENARDWLIIGCWTGLRASDLLSLKIESFDFKLGFISSRNRKTKSNVLIPIHPVVEDIIMSRGCRLPESISLNSFNKLIKVVGRKANINSMVRDLDSPTGYCPKYLKISSHCCRRTFATNNYLEGTIEPEQLKFLTGHSSVRMLMRYIQIDNLTAAKSLKAVWDRRANKI